MNNILKSLFSGFFRKLGSIFAILFIIYLFSLIAISKDIKLPSFIRPIFMVVKADTTGTYTSARLEVNQCYTSCSVSGTNCYFENCSWDNKNIGTTMTFGSSNGKIRKYQWLIFNSGDGWSVGKWDIVLENTINPLATQDLITYNYKFYSNVSASTNGTLEGYNNSYISNYVCQQYTENGKFYVRCTFTNKVTLKYIAVELYKPDDYGFSAIENINNITWNRISNFSGVTDATSAINNQTTIIQNEFNETNTKIDNINDSLNDDNVNGATDEASNFFSNFTSNTHGLTGIITAPLNAIQSLTSTTCSPLILPLPYINKDLPLPCMRNIYDENFAGFMILYDTITLGIVSYWVMVRIFALVKDFKNPDHDEIEVLDL